jgi:hypothetical protein
MALRLDPERGAAVVIDAVEVMVEGAVAMRRPQPFGFSSEKAEVMFRGGLLRGRQMRSPAPVHSASPSESWISGRQSIAVLFAFSEYQYMEVSGAMPRRSMSSRRYSAFSTSMMTALARRMVKRKAPETLAPSRSAQTTTVSEFACGVSK